MTKPKAPPSAAFAPADYHPADVSSIQALHRGEATPDQQKQALAFIVGTIAEKDGLSWRPGADGAWQTAFAEGRRFVGLQIVKMLNMSLRDLVKKELENVSGQRRPR